MKKKIKFFFFGFGQTARYLTNDLIKSKIRYSLNATDTRKTKSLIFNKKRLKSFKFKDKIFDKKLIKYLKSSDYILVSIPPQNNKDLVTSKEFWWKGQSELIKKLLDNHTV